MNNINNPKYNEEKNIDVIELVESDEDNPKINIVEESHPNHFEEEDSSSDLSSKLSNHNIKIEDYLNGKRNNAQAIRIPKINLTFEESMGNLKNNFRKLFNKKNNLNTDTNIFNNKKFRQAFNTNKNMQLIFKLTDIIKEIYENQLQFKMSQRNCDINRIIDIYINKIKKLSNQRKIVVKDYNNLIYVVGAEVYINKIETHSREFIIKKRTETFKGNNKVNTSEDDCYIIEINCNKKKKQKVYESGEITSALIMLLQNLTKDAVFK